MSADLFAAFGDSSSSQQQSQPKHNPTKSVPAATSFVSTSAFDSSAPNTSRQQWSQSAGSSLHQYQRSWQTGQPKPALPTQPPPITSSAFQSLGSSDTGDFDDDDGWGNFEIAPNNAPLPVFVPTAPTTPKQVTAEPPRAAQTTGLQRTRIVRASTLDMVSNSLVNFKEVTPQPSQPTRSRLPVADIPPSSAVPKALAVKEKQSDPNVLFDADDFEGEHDSGGLDDDSDFGEFETVSLPPQPTAGALPTAPPSKVERASNLLLDLNLDDASPASARMTKNLPMNPVQQHIDAPDQSSNGSNAPLKTGRVRSNQFRTESQDFDEDWALADALPQETARASTKSAEASWDWEPVEEPEISQPVASVKEVAKPPCDSGATNNDDASWDWGEVEASSANLAEVEEAVALPPVNIPPPSILMSIFPQLFNEANEQLYTPICGQSSTIKDRVLSDPRVYEFLRGYLTLAVVAARVVAGRKMRWHRDKYLAQSMSISAAGSKGMKLAGVDKMQTAREDREANDVVSAWKSQAGRLKSTVASVNAAMKKKDKALRIPEITDTIQAQTVKGVPTALKPCVLCGLKRNERVAKIDHEVEDSFGEWWVDHWGHVACKRFWLQHEKTLRQR